MGSLVKKISDIPKSLASAYNKPTLMQAMKAGGWKVLIDGNLAETMLFHSPGGTLVGEDALGNKYYERLTDQWGRHRWVVLKDLDKQTGQEATAVGADWHGWLHFISDTVPTTVPDPKPIFWVAHRPTRTMTQDRCLPKGAWVNKQKRRWGKIGMWGATAEAATRSYQDDMKGVTV